MPVFAGRRLDNHRVLPDQPIALPRLDHRHANTVLDGTQRVEKLAFDRDLGVESCRDAIELNEWRSANGLGDPGKNLAHNFLVERIRS